MTRDRVGLLWRPELAAEIFTHIDAIEVVEVIAEDWLDASASKQRALRTLAAQVPVSLHGVSMGLASAAPVAPRRLDAMARLVEAVRPIAWSEHLAFVRGGGVEIGHLAAPPRTLATLEGTERNVAAAARAVGTRPRLENVATLIAPPGSRMGEVEWLRAVLDATGADLLLDLHNLHANACNFGFDAHVAVLALPPERIAEIHLAGGRLVGEAPPRVLDDHLHDVPDAVFELLERAAAHASGPLTVILERDGHFPDFTTLLAQLERARQALGRGRLRRSVPNEHRL
jgi:uncharacterized protein (UPF0276 family)